MAFPASPTNGQQAVVGNVTYQYSSSNNAWSRVAGTIPAFTATGNVQGGNLISAGYVTAVGNITGAYFIGNGSQLTGLPAGYSNADVATYLASGTDSSNIVTTGNVTGGNITTTGLASIGGFTISANTIISAGSTLTLDPNSSGGTDGEVVIAGNLQVQGNVTYINSNVVSINDLVFNTANNASSPSQANNGGLGVGPAGAEYATWLYNVTANAWTSNIGISAVGNVEGSYIIGNGAYLTGLSAGYANSDVASYLASGTLSTDILTTGAVSTTGNITGGNIITTGNLVTGNIVTAGSGGNISGANFILANVVSASGNVTGNYILGNGALLTGVITSVANINNGTSNVTVTALDGDITVGVSGVGNVAVFTPTGASITGVVTATGNITGGNLVTAGGITAAGNIVAGGVRTTTSATAPSTPAVGDMWFDTTINIIYRYTYDGISYFWEDFTGGSLAANTSAIVNGSSNVAVYNTGNVTVGVSGVGNVAVVSPTTMTLAANLLPAANNVYSLGSPTAQWASVYLSANTLYLGNTPISANNSSSTLTINGNTVVTADPTGTSSTTGNVQVVGNVTGSNLLSDGIVSATGTITGGNLVSGNITVAGDTISSANSIIYIDPAAAGNTGLVIIQGNLQVTGNTTTINSNTVSINDLVFNTANNAASGSQANGGGLGVGPADAEYATLLYSNSGNTWISNLGISSAGNIVGVNYTGTTASVSGNINGGNLTTGIISATGSITTLGGVTATGNVAGGNIAGTLLTGTLATSAQPNVTSVGTLTSLTASGLISTTGNVVGASLLGTTVSVSGNVSGGNIVSSGTVSAAGLNVGGTATLPGTSTTFASRITNIAESANVIAAAPSSTTNFYVNNGAVQYYTSNATTNFTLNFAFSSGTTLNSAMAVGDSVSLTLIVTNGSTGYYASAFQIDGSAVTVKWQGSAPTSGDASAIDSYTFVIIKTASATYTVLASVTKFS